MNSPTTLLAPESFQPKIKSAHEAWWLASIHPRDDGTQIVTVIASEIFPLPVWRLGSEMYVNGQKVQLAELSRASVYFRDKLTF